MRYEGQITIITDEFTTPRVLVDAEPHIMQRLRKIFDNSANYFNRGKYTHKPIVFPMTLTACRDLIWLMDRYSLECEPSFKVDGTTVVVIDTNINAI